MMLNSAVAVVADTDTQGNELFVLLIEGATPEGIGFQFLYLAKGTDAAEEHFRIVLLSIFPDFTDVLEHVYLQVRRLLGGHTLAPFITSAQYSGHRACINIASTNHNSHST